MDSGFIVDFTGSEWSKQSSWVEGTAQRNFWGSVSGGDKFDSCGGRKSDSRQHGLAAG
jgi:hypothetical protein